MARYFRISITDTNLNGPFDVYYGIDGVGPYDFASLYNNPPFDPPQDAVNQPKSAFTGGNKLEVIVPDNALFIYIIQNSPYVESRVALPATPAPTTAAPTTAAPTTAAPTPQPTTAAPTTAAPTTAAPTTASPTTSAPTTAAPTTAAPTTASPTTASPTTASPTTAAPTTAAPTTAAPTTASPTTASPTTASPTTASPTTASPTTASPTTAAPTTAAPTTAAPTTAAPTPQPTTAAPTTAAPTTAAPTTPAPTIPPTGVSCYNIFFTSYTIGECYSFPNEYESMQTVGIELSGSSIVDVYISGSLTDGTPFAETIPAGYNGTYIIANRSCGCYYAQCLTGNGIQDISVTAYSGSIAIPYCGNEPNQFIALFPTQSLFITAMSYNCATPSVRFNFTGGVAPYSASISRDANGNPIWAYTNITSTPFDATSVPSGQIYYPVMKDATGTIVEGSPMYDCATLDTTFKVVPLNNLASANIYYPPILVSGSQNKGTSFTATGSRGTLIGVTSLVDSGTTFIGWSYDSSSRSGIFSSSTTLQVPLTTTGSTIYALVERNVVSASFCYYSSDPIGTVDCEACAVTKTIYYNGASLTGSNYTNVTWFKDANLTTTADAGYYKLIESTPKISNPIYQVSAGPVQTRTLTGFCLDSTLTC